MKKTLTVKEWNRICLQEMVLKGLVVFTKDGYRATRKFYEVMVKDLIKMRGKRDLANRGK